MRILIVEDEIKLAKAVKRALELQQYVVDVAYNGLKGQDFALAEEFDVIILDVMLPELDGVTLAKKIREHNIHTPILMLTAKSQIADKVTGLDVGADDYMIKPFSFEELFARIRALVRRPKNIQHPVITVGDITLDSQRYTVTKHNQVIPLSAKEFSLLEYLMRNKNSVLTRDQIISQVWNYEADILPNTVEVHIKHLRDKLRTPLIYTVRGRGYCIKGK